ncbi:hypothetical protein ES708_05866 [subsurface metagenome]
MDRDRIYSLLEDIVGEDNNLRSGITTGGRSGKGTNKNRQKYTYPLQVGAHYSTNNLPDTIHHTISNPDWLLQSLIPLCTLPKLPSKRLLFPPTPVAVHLN